MDLRGGAAGGHGAAAAGVRATQALAMSANKASTSASSSSVSTGSSTGPTSGGKPARPCTARVLTSRIRIGGDVNSVGSLRLTCGACALTSRMRLGSLGLEAVNLELLGGMPVSKGSPALGRSPSAVGSSRPVRQSNGRSANHRSQGAACGPGRPPLALRPSTRGAGSHHPTWFGRARRLSSDLQGGRCGNVGANQPVDR